MKRLQIAAGATFLGAWIVGLVLAASGPAPDDPATKVAGYFTVHEQRSMVAHFLIDGVAGVAIAAIALSLYRFLAGSERLRRLLLSAGLAAAVASLVQMIVGETVSYRAANGAAVDSVKTLFTVLNDGDTVKIAFLAIMIGAASLLARRSGAFPRWLATAGLVFAPLLAISGLAFPLESNALYASLELTLIGLLSWVLAVTVVVARRAPRAETATPATVMS
jgi:hypothetical protein